MSAKILIVEDEPAIQELLVFNVTQAGFVALRASDAEEAWQQIRDHAPDLILLDWMLPSTSGVVLAKQLRSEARTKDVPIIMLTARGDERDKVLGLESGADDYITKPFSPRELMARIRAVMRRHIPTLSEDKVAAGGLELSPTSHRVTAKGLTIELGPTEFRLLHFFMTHVERVYSRTQLLDQVWGTQVFVEERTVDVHIRRLRASLEVSGLDGLIQTVRGSGYRFSTNS
ncbi:MAG TPA: phosphate regulon transcriptional regulatory protein PhoB [Gallionella sp.]|nr:phosphate regulon transcriptional regulator PhoB [Gallionella sp.]OGS66919.1 MAG: phosphate regulon transcriptional regulatory protein PhoB [Gallionellales bacterium GWA2_54_124]OGT20577.1 MAG: phosphate regulon transcriptional regulatory protein PhoB [Gallionellales bacterium RIFOXYD12_FULL_53_10]OGT29252.1 MAG: phosphate regulon transcriptional regulatory protein PhoB [Gallionellales bacterium RIFOXYD2_FULL_52_7]HCI53701.1 phosphate regulon transcriptional regulatory protein PhoB [Gallione